jgi:hypothetical protein
MQTQYSLLPKTMMQVEKKCGVHVRDLGSGHFGEAKFQRSTLILIASGRL